MDEPDIVKELKEKEKHGLLTNQTQNVFQEVEQLDESKSNAETDGEKTIEALRESEERYRDLFENASDIIQSVDTDGSFIYVNNSWKKILGYSDEEINSLKVFDIVHPKSKQHCMNLFNQIMSGKPIDNIEASFITKDGKEIIVEGSVNCRFADGKPVSTRGIFRDITRRKKMELALKESEGKYRTLFESSRDAIMMLVPPTWKFTAGNPSTIEMFNVKDEKEFTIYGPWDVSPEHQPDGQLSSEKAKNMINKAMENGSNFFEWTHKRLSGEEFPTTVLLTRIELEGKQLLQATVRDVTEWKKAEKELKELNLSLEQKVKERTADVVGLLKQKDEFIQQLGHDLKTPLTPITTLLPIIKKKIDDEHLRDMLDVVIKNSEYMKNLAIKTLQLARLNSPTLELKHDRINLLVETSQIIENMRYTLDTNNMIIENKIDPKMYVVADKLRFEELIGNLISNSTKYKKEGGGKIVLTAKKEGDTITVSIKDEGRGMTKEQIDNVFNEFYKTDESRHGKIWIESDGIDKGSTFYFTFNT